jgi:hypothetical protein
MRENERERERTRISGKEREALDCKHEDCVCEYDVDAGTQTLAPEPEDHVCEYAGKDPQLLTLCACTIGLNMPIASTSHIHVSP